MTALPFTKMHGLGNDFVVLDGRAQPLVLEIKDLQQLANRRTGIGCDQVLLIENAARPQGYATLRYRVFNPDGSEVEQCGNGVRCVARWLFDRGEISQTAALLGGAGEMQISILDGGQVSVDMGQPVFAPRDVPLESSEPGPVHEIMVGQQMRHFAVLSMGNPHAVLEVADVENAPVKAVGAALQNHPAFPQQVNVGFAQVTGPSSVSLRVYERGAGETQACGSGACAAAVALLLRERVASPVSVQLPGGPLVIEWSGPGARVMMTGAAEYAFSGQIALNAG